jgi:hypothetical protein
MKKYSTLGLAIVIAGCANVHGKPAADANKAIPVEDVVRQVKKELNAYQLYALAHENDQPRENACRGDLKIKIDSVTVTLTAQVEVTADGNLGLSIPVGAVGSLGPSMSLVHTDKQTETIKFTLYPTQPDTGGALAYGTAYGAIPLHAKPTELGGIASAATPLNAKPTELFDGTPIANGLIAVRESLLAASNVPPCIKLNSPEPKQDNSIDYAFSVVQTAKAGVNFKFLLFGAGANAGLKTDNGNTISVKYKMYGETK